MGDERRWAVIGEKPRGDGVVIGVGLDPMAVACDRWTADKMCRVVNAHADLVAAVRALYESACIHYDHDWSGLKAQARAAMDKARGTTPPEDDR